MDEIELISNCLKNFAAVISCEVEIDGSYVEREVSNWSLRIKIPGQKDFLSLFQYRWLEYLTKGYFLKLETPILKARSFREMINHLKHYPENHSHIPFTLEIQTNLMLIQKSERHFCNITPEELHSWLKSFVVTALNIRR